MDKRPTETQYQIRAYIEHFRDVKGYSPTKREIADAMGFSSSNSIQEQLKKMAKKKILTVAANTARGIVLL